MHTKATRRKMSVAHKGKILTEATKAKISAALKGRRKSKATRRLMSKNHKGHKLSEETKQLIKDRIAIRKLLGLSYGRKGKKMTPKQLAAHKAMLQRTKPWTHPNSKEALKKAIKNSADNRSIRAMARPRTEREKRKKKERRGKNSYY